jgi:hypothetical protein
MANEKELKDAARRKKICSISGRVCRCDDGAGCTRTRRDSALDPIPNSAIRWARTSELRLAESVADLDLALDELKAERPYPAPEWREARRLIVAALNYLRETNGA